MRLSRLTLLFLISSGALASPAEEPVEQSIPILESTQELLGYNINRVANRLDMFFADQRADDELARSRIRVRQRYEIRERALMDSQTQFRINIRLPSLEEKFRFDYKKKPDSQSPQTEAVGKKDPNLLQEEWQFRSDVGLSVKIPPNVFVRGRARKNWQTWKVVHRFVEELAWFSDRDWEETTTFDSDLPLTENSLFRFRNIADWRITRKDFTTSHGPSILQRVSEDDALSYSITMSTLINNGVWFVTNYRLAPTWRRNLYKHWLYSDLTAGLDFPKIWSFRRTPFALVQLEALFGQ